MYFTLFAVYRCFSWHSPLCILTLTYKPFFLQTTSFTSTTRSRVHKVTVSLSHHTEHVSRMGLGREGVGGEWWWCSLSRLSCRREVCADTSLWINQAHHIDRYLSTCCKHSSHASPHPLHATTLCLHYLLWEGGCSILSLDPWGCQVDGDTYAHAELEHPWVACNDLTHAYTTTRVKPQCHIHNSLAWEGAGVTCYCQRLGVGLPSGFCELVWLVCSVILLRRQMRHMSQDQT